ncbi:hypothetical protein [Flavobacterium microcysteis]|uniref:Uncharacterized protein n=1 Tax=Flavobacterium microcysteis TaxID=2596891 RepID=A0A501QLL8_9FLAO|nr:hypothetical protein [Flavobacterium microcysteis]TPD73660.1 hypothetical protein FJA49_00265 [Flavobacterium microcysteis]
MATKNVTKAIVVICLLIASSCKVKNNDATDRVRSYKVITIDSISNVYIIRVKEQQKYFKIVSQKSIDSPINCNKIKVGKTYSFNLTSLFIEREKLPVNIDAVDFQGQSIELEKDSIYDIHKSENLRGLCFIRK